MDKKKSSRLIRDGNAFKYIYGIFYINATQPTAPYNWKYNRMKFSDIDTSLYEKEQEQDEPDQLVCLADIDNALDDVDEFFVYKVLYFDYLNKKINTPSYSVKKISIDADIPKQTLVVKFIDIVKELKKIIK